MGKVIVFILGIIILYFAVNYILTKINSYYSKKYIPYDINTKDLNGFDKWRNIVALISLLVACIIGLIILLINYYFP